ncbi:MAG: response regulator transcription factor [Balneolales bacterium]|nr:response regulator transcription factor [Balneolales bacterium]
MSYRICICEDHLIIIDGVRRILSQTQNYKLTSNCNSIGTLMQMLQNDVPDILILDLNLPDQSGLDVLPDLKATYPAMKVMVLTMHSEPTVMHRVYAAGANGLLLKDFGEKEMIDALDEMVMYGIYRNPKLGEISQDIKSSKALFLTPREKEIVKLTANGFSSSDIAKDLFLSPHTVNTHRRNIYKKLDLKDMRELVNFAHQNELN